MMKKLFVIIFAVLTTVGLALPVWAAPTFMAGDEGHPVTVDAAIDDDAYIGANTAIINADINGDLLIGANTAQINSKVNGDLWVGANTVTINNRVVGDVRIGAGEVIINSTVDDDVIVGTGNLVVGDKAVIRGDLIVGSGNAVVNGRVYGGARIFGGSVTLNAVIGGSVEVKADESLTILPGTKIGGELSYWAPKENLDFVKYAKTVTYHPTVTKRSSLPMLGAFMWMIPAISISFLLWNLLCVLLMGAVLIWLMPKLLPRVAVLIKKD
jgi:carbonic anhydrase/acetyltransferase-like protein (isoleucine patch superfamily)